VKIRLRDWKKERSTGRKGEGGEGTGKKKEGSREAKLISTLSMTTYLLGLEEETQGRGGSR